MTTDFNFFSGTFVFVNTGGAVDPAWDEDSHLETPFDWCSVKQSCWTVDVFLTNTVGDFTGFFNGAISPLSTCF
jgi:hypothetical protein